MAVVSFILKFAEKPYVDTNKMNHHNLALMFAPNLFRMRKGMDDAVSMATVGLMQQHVNSLEVIMDNYREMFGDRTNMLKKFVPIPDKEIDFTYGRVDFGVS